ncbi:unnamed protein product [Closterium sp. NIES-65]|nr:unnamed protein product [Closterium sp. NIES-65]
MVSCRFPSTATGPIAMCKDPRTCLPTSPPPCFPPFPSAVLCFIASPLPSTRLPPSQPSLLRSPPALRTPYTPSPSIRLSHHTPHSFCALFLPLSHPFLSRAPLPLPSPAI